jgi:hypothetical protein
MTSGALVMDLSSLASQGAVNTPGASGASIILSKITNFNAPKLDVSGVVSVVAATDITIHDFSVGGTGAFGTTVYSLAAKNLTVNGLAATNSITFNESASIFPKLVTLNVTGDAATSSPYITTQTNAVSVTSDVLTTFTTGGTIDMVSLHGAAKLTALTSSGYARDFQLFGASIITSADINHDHIEGSDAARFEIVGASKLTTVAPTALDEVGTVTLIGLPKMTSLNLSSMKTLPILGTYTMTISSTGLTGSYGIASEATTTTQAYAEKVYSDDLMTLKPLMTLSAASGVVTYAFAGDIISAVATRTFDADGVPGALSTAGSANSTATLVTLMHLNSPFVNSASTLATHTAPRTFIDGGFTSVAAE